MQTSREDFIQHFSELSDAALLEVPREDLVQIARDCLDEEIARRGLHAAVAGEPVASVEEADHSEPDMALVGEYQDPAEADLARNLLRSAGIEATLMNEKMAHMLNIPFSPGTSHLLVPVESEDDAVAVLHSEISDEDLAAQAEAAGEVDEEPAKEIEELN